jgi:hypothetical protein
MAQTSDDELVAGLSREIVAHAAPHELPLKALLVLACVALVAIVAGALYLATPRWKIWHRRLVPLPREDAPELVDGFAAVPERGGGAAAATPVNPLDPSAAALAFGPRRECVAVGGGLAGQF